MALIGEGKGGGEKLGYWTRNTNGGDRHAGRGWGVREGDGLGSVTPSSVQGSCKRRLRGAELASPASLHRRRLEEGSRVNRRIFAPAAQKLHKVVLKRCFAFQVFKGRRVLRRICRGHELFEGNDSRLMTQWHTAKQPQVETAPVQRGWKRALIITWGDWRVNTKG